jgi:chorismate mutase
MSRIDRIISLLQELEALPAPTADAGIGAWRERIDRIDRIVLELLNERSHSANEIGHVKQQLGLPIYVPEREHQVLDGVLHHNPGPLEDAAVRRLFERIIDETRSLERRRYQNRPPDDDAPAEG